MARKVISIDTEVLSQLEELRANPKIYKNNQERRSITAVIRKLLHNSQELARIEQSAMSAIDNSLNSAKPRKSTISTPQKALKKSDESIILFCFDCQVQTVQRKLNTGKWKCSQCGNKRST